MLPLYVCRDLTFDDTYLQVLFAHSSVLAGMKELRSQRNSGDWEHDLLLEDTAADTALLLWHLYDMLFTQPRNHYVSCPELEDAASLARMAYKLGMPGITGRIDALLSRDSDLLLHAQNAENRTSEYRGRVIESWLLAEQIQPHHV